METKESQRERNTETQKDSEKWTKRGRQEDNRIKEPATSTERGREAGRGRGRVV